MKTHFTWSIESPRGKCPFCQGETLLVLPCATWDVQTEGHDAGWVNVEDEVSGHYCEACDRLVSLSLNTLDAALDASMAKEREGKNG